jgi:uncharacterized protein
MTRIELDVVGISSSQTQTGAYALILAERLGHRRLPIIIGAFEAQAIVIELEKMRPQRPLTHDLFRTFAMAHQIMIREVLISKFQEGIFYAEIYSVDTNGDEVVIDARTSDAVAIALRFNCPVYTVEEVMTQAGITMDPDPEEEEDEDGDITGDTGEPKTKSLADYDTDALKVMLEDAVKGENYELASQIRDEINRRKQQHD